MDQFEIHLNEQDPRNVGVIQYQQGRNFHKLPACAAPDSYPDPYMELGSHPEIVERVWDQLGGALPVNCRCIVYGTPALVAPRSGIVLAVAFGTQYGLRLLERTVAEALKAGARTVEFNGKVDIQREFGSDWVFGPWLKREAEWLRAVFRTVEEQAGLDSHPL